MKSDLRIAVVGGSITGPVTALLLLRGGFDHVTVYEQMPPTRQSGGGLISLEHSSLDILDRLGVDQGELVTYPSERLVQMSVRNRVPDRAVTRVYPGRHTTWTQLHHALTSRLPDGTVHTGHRVVGLSEDCGFPLLHFAAGQNACADLVVFADGRASLGRRILDPDRRLRYAGYVAHRGMAPPHAPQQYDFLRLEPCPGAQLNIAPVPGGLDWTFYLNATSSRYAQYFGADPDQRPFVVPDQVSDLARVDIDAHAQALLPVQYAAIVQATTIRMAVPVADIDVPGQMVWPVGDGHAVLLGDALAPVRPHTARGANNGIEQAAGLCAVLHQHRKYGADLGGALHGWQRRHLPTAQAAVRLGPAIGAKLGLGTAANHLVGVA
ncbi:monooxygenase [Phytohabitans rumicis]|uniref:FAD-binding domain-containing protein n=1 Tax=Phytohabitans rumicis TaxID=1076125 RepID=A0A6V8LCD9_9ACTN|nr:monooxygenase [Phytohabitans rumicis]GFJ93310.1 hypothetical protein Prum_069520 [Phytohabitans rumicis]